MKLAVVELQPVEIEAEVEAMTQGGEFDEIRGVHKTAGSVGIG